MIDLPEAPIQTVRPDWIDANGHMNVAYYLMAFDQAAEAVFNRFGMGQSFVDQTGLSLFTLDVRIRYRREVLAGAAIGFRFLMLDGDDRRVHFAMTMLDAASGKIAADFQQVSIVVDLSTRRAAAIPEDRRAAIADLIAAHAGLPRDAVAAQDFGLRGRT